MDIITIDGMVEHDFRHSIEDMLRLNQIDEAVARLRGLLESYAVGDGEILPSRFLRVTWRDIEFGGWNRLADRVHHHDRRKLPISAIGVTLADHRKLGGSGPAKGWRAPYIKTFYFSDEAYPFSDATREDLLDGYSREGFEWQGDYQASDVTLSIKGLDDLHGAIVELEDRLYDTHEPDEREVRIGAVGACYLAVLIHQALRETILSRGLPRPLCVLAACDGVYPFFDAPVTGCDEAILAPTPEAVPDEFIAEEVDAASAGEDEDFEEDVPAAASLLTLVTRKAAKAPVMILGEDDVEAAARLGELAEAELVANGDVRGRKQALEVSPGEGRDHHDAEAAPDLAGIFALDRLAETAEFSVRPAFVPWDDEPEYGEDGVAIAALPTPDAPAPATLDGAESPAAPPAAHSLRARIKMAEPDLRETFADRVRAFVTRLTLTLLGR